MLSVKTSHLHESCHMETKVLLRSDPGRTSAINSSSADDGLVTSSSNELNSGKAPSVGAPVEEFWPEMRSSLPRYVVNASVRDTSEMIYGTAVIMPVRHRDKNLRRALEASSDQLSKRESESSYFAAGRSEFALRRCSSLYGNFVIRERDSDNVANGITAGGKRECFNDTEFCKEHGNIFRFNSVESLSSVVNAGRRSFRLSQLSVRPNSCPPGYLCFQNRDQNFEFGDALRERLPGERHSEKVYGKRALDDIHVSAKK